MEDLRIFDFLDTKFQETLYRSGSVYKNARQILNDNKDKIQSGKATLRVKTDATFSGLPTNGRLYPAIRVKTGAKTWLEDYAKPVLTHHKSGLGIFSEPADPIGRIHGYRYLSFLDKELKTDADEDIFKEDGTGVLQLESDITDPDAIQKIMDGRYKTVSVGFVPSNLSCTICNKDWKMGEPCEHIPNNRYTKSKSSDNFSVSKKGKLCLLRAGDISYLEQSFVNVPAASKAGVTSFEVLNDALDKMEIGSFPSACVLVDSLQIEDLSFTGVSTKDKEVIEILDKKDPEDWVTEEDVRPISPTATCTNKPSESEENSDPEEGSLIDVSTAIRLLNQAKVFSASKDTASGANNNMVKVTSTPESKDAKSVDAIVPCSACQEAKDKMVPVTEQLNGAKARITELEDKYKILVEEN